MSDCRALVVYRFCDFGRCAPSCWKRCPSPWPMLWRARRRQMRKGQTDLFEAAA